MSTPATAVAAEAPPTKRSGKKKKLLLAAVAAVVLLAIAAGAALWLLRAPAEPDDADEAAPARDVASARHAAKAPVFLPLEPFTVNLADRDSDRYVQIAVTLEIEDAHFGDRLREYMPAIRHNILMVLAQKSAAELLTPEGKDKLAREIRRETLRPLGIAVDDAARDAGDEATAKKGQRKKAAPPVYPVRSVQFASFIIQ